MSKCRFMKPITLHTPGLVVVLGRRSAFVWYFVRSVLTQTVKPCARCCRRSVFCVLLVIEYARMVKTTVRW